jgi:hypothetical protein
MPDLDDHFRALTSVQPPEEPPDFRDRPPQQIVPPPRHPQRIVAILVALLVAAGGIFAVTRAFDRGTRVGQFGSPEPSLTGSPSEAPPGGVFRAMYDAVQASSPSGWTFSFQYGQVGGDWIIDGYVDDGSGPGRLHVDVSTQPGGVDFHACYDQESPTGAQCSTYYLVDNGALEPNSTTVPDGTKTLEVGLVDPHRSGIVAEADVTRDQPLYTADQLGELLQAVDRAVQNCLSTNC